MKTWHWVAISAPILACTCVGAGVGLLVLTTDRSARSGLEDYSTQVLSMAAGPPTTLERCYGSSTVRVAACSARGTKTQVSELVAALKATPISHLPGKYESDEACGALTGFHVPSGALAPGTTLHAPHATMPPNDQNLVLQYVYVDSTGERVCLGFKYPYG